MNLKLLLALVLLVSLVTVIKAKIITVYINNTQHGTAIDIDDNKTVGKLMTDYIEFERLSANKYSRLEGKCGYTYNPRKTLLEAGIKDRITLKYKDESRATDIGMGILCRLTCIDLYNH